MLSSNGNPYLRPEYLNPPPTTTMDSKKSPLALLAQTCSQIGADPQVPASNNNKNCNGATAQERKKSVSERDKSSPLSVGGSSSSDGANRVQQPAGSCNSGGQPSPAPPKSSGGSKNTKESRLTPSSRDSDRRSKSTSPKNPNRNSSAAGTGPAVPAAAAAAAAAAASAEPSPAPNGLMTPSASLMDPAAALSLANYKSLMAQAGMAGSPYSPASYSPYSGGFGPSGYPPGLDLGAYASALNAAVAKSSMPFPTSTAAMMSGYLASQHPAAYSAALAMQYGRMKNPSLFTAPATTPTDGGNCRDPYCTGCPGNNNNNPLASPSSVQHHMVCTAGCGLGVQCEHLKVPIPAHHLMAMPSASSSPGGGGPSLSSPGNQRPYVCNWIVGDNYCGKRFPSSDDLLQHLRTHTNLSSSAESAAAASAAAASAASVATSSSSAVHPSSAAAFAHPSSMMRAYPTPPLSPLSAARYHPYGKSPGQHPAAAPSLPPQQAGPQGFPAGLFHPHHHPAAAAAAAAAAAMAAGSSSPYPPSALFHHPALAPYYSHLSLFAPRGLGSAPLPP